ESLPVLCGQTRHAGVVAVATSRVPPAGGLVAAQDVADEEQRVDRAAERVLAVPVEVELHHGPALAHAGVRSAFQGGEHGDILTVGELVDDGGFIEDVDDHEGTSFVSWSVRVRISTPLQDRPGLLR